MLHHAVPSPRPDAPRTTHPVHSGQCIYLYADELMPTVAPGRIFSRLAAVSRPRATKAATPAAHLGLSRTAVIPFNPLAEFRASDKWRALMTLGQSDRPLPSSSLPGITIRIRQGQPSSAEDEPSFRFCRQPRDPRLASAGELQGSSNREPRPAASSA